MGLHWDGTFFWSQASNFWSLEAKTDTVQRFEPHYQVETWYKIAATIRTSNQTLDYAVYTNSAAPALFFESKAIPIQKTLDRTSALIIFYTAPKAETDAGVSIDELKVISKPE